MATNKDFVVKNGLQVGANTSIEGSITTVDSVQFDANAGITVSPGQLAWNADAGTLDLGITDDVTLQVGQETHIHVKAAEAISDGDVVYASGAVGNSGQIEVSKYIADGSIEEQTVVGIATQDIASGEFGYVTAFGAVRGISTDGSTLTTPETWADGTILYVSPNVAGELTSTLPVAPNQAIPIAFVTTAHASNGTLFVRAYELGSHLGEIHDVYINAVANNQILTYDAVNSRWANSDDLNLPGSLTVAGDFTVSGNTTYVNTDNLSVEDAVVTLASGATTPLNDIGLLYNRYGDSANTSNYNVFMGWDEPSSGILISPTTNGPLTANANNFIDWEGSAVANGTPNFYFGLDLSNFYMTGPDPDIRQNMIPQADGSYVASLLQHQYQVNGDDRFEISVHRATGAVKINTDVGNIADTGNTLPVIQFQAGQSIGGDPFNQLFLAGDKTSVGINTSNPAYELDVNGDIGADSIIITTANTTTLNATTVNATTLNGAFGNTAVTIGSSYGTTPSTGNMWFDNLNLKLKIFDGSNWQDAVPAGAGGGTSNTATTDANSTFAKYTYVLSSATSTVSGADVANNTLSYDTSGIENIEVFVNGVKQVEGASYDYTATTGVSVGFTTTLSAGDVVDVQVYELLTNDAFVLKAGGAFEGTVEYTNTSIAQTFTNANLNHGMTLISDTDEYLRINREAANGNGGVRLSAMTDGSTAFNVSAYSTSPSTDGNNAVIRLRASKANGTSEQPLAADEDVLTIGNTGTELVTLKGSGRLGIGTSDPNAPLHVKTVDEVATRIESSHNNGTHLVISNSDVAVGRKTFLNFAPANNVTGALITVEAIEDFSSTAARTADMYFSTRKDGTISEQLRIDSSGNVSVLNGILYLNNALNLNSVASAIPGNGGIARLSNGYTYFSGKNNDLGAVLSNGDGTATVRAMNPGSSAGYLNFETGNGNLRLQIDTSGHLVPGANATQDLGTANNAWRNIYTNDLHLSNEGHEEGNSVDGTKGNWTIQEGEDHLYIINNKNGKKFRFALEEVE